jgi:hypothetical protein
MVAALIIGSAIEPRPVCVKVGLNSTIFIPECRLAQARNDERATQIVGFHGAGITR